MQKIASYVASSVLLLLTCCNEKKQHAGAVFPTEIIAVKVAPIVMNPSRGILTATGLVTTSNQANYAFKIGGIVRKIFVSEGDHFRKGQQLAALQLTEIDSQLDQANLAYEKSRRDLVRATNLYKDSVATLEQLQNATTGLDIAERARRAVSFNKKYANIFAKADGFVTKKLVNENEVVSPGAPVIATNEISENNAWTIKVGLTDQDWAKVSVGQSATATLDAFPGKLLKASVFRKAQAADAATGSFQAELKFDAKEVRPALGMFARVTILTQTEGLKPSIPYDALIEADGDNAFVFVPDTNNRVKRLPVIIERFDNHKVYIRSGLENVREVVVGNSAFLNEKSIIRIIK
jgi:RND family efflux transporter MFP subunit